MALTLDGYAIFKGIGSSPTTFAKISSEVIKQGPALLLKEVKAKKTDVEKLRAIDHAIGHDVFALFIYEMKDADIQSVIKRLDKHHPDIASSDQEWRRQHLVALAAGEAVPAEKMTKSNKRTKPKLERQKEKEVVGLESKAMAAVRRRDGRRETDESH